MRQILAWTSNEIHRRKIKRKSTKKKKEIQQKTKKWADQQLNRNEELICVKEKALDKLRYCNIWMKRLKIKGARIRNNKIFEEDHGVYYYYYYFISSWRNKNTKCYSETYTR